MLCCYAEWGFPNSIEDAAGIYGDYNCDTPVDLLFSMGEYIKKEVKPDAIFWTGDVSPHDQWKYTPDSVMSYEKFLSDYMKANFTNYSVHVLEGNHDFPTINS